MKRNGENDRFLTSRGTLYRLIQALTLALIVALALPALAANRAVKSRVAPLYPEMAKRMRITGTVRVEATVDAEGKVTAVKTLEGNRMLSAAAEDAVHKWKFEAGPAETTEEVILNFAASQ
jgi:TonB family protein